MRRLALRILAVALGTAGAGLLFAAGVLFAAGEQDDAVKKEMKKLEGAWMMQSFETNGKPAPEETVKQIRLVIKGNQYLVDIGDRKIEMTFKIDPSKNPKTIDFTLVQGDEKAVTLGIYELKDDTFKMCRTAEAGQKRPTEFSAKEGSGMVLAVYKREKK